MYSRIILICVAVATVALASNALAASTAGSANGVWSGKTTQRLAPLGEGGTWVTWTQRIVVRTNQGRVSGITGNFRDTCADPQNPMAGDVRIIQGWKIGTGPKLTAANTFAVTISTWSDGKRELPLYAPVSIRGVLGKGGASGSFTLD